MSAIQRIWAMLSCVGSYIYICSRKRMHLLLETLFGRLNCWQWFWPTVVMKTLHHTFVMVKEAVNWLDLGETFYREVRLTKRTVQCMPWSLITKIPPFPSRNWRSPKEALYAKLKDEEMFWGHNNARELAELEQQQKHISWKPSNRT